MKTTFIGKIPFTAPRTPPADTIRLARLADAPAVAELIERSYLAVESGGDQRRRPRCLLDAALPSAQRPIHDGTCYVAESGRRLIGVCAWGRRTDHAEPGVNGAGAAATASIRALAVHPDHPPLALSRLLLILCEAAAGRQGFDALEAAPIPSQRWLYVACGFRPMGPLDGACPHDVTVARLLVRRPIAAQRRFLRGD